MSTRLELASIVSLVLGLGGCCVGVEDEVYTRTHQGSVMDEQLDEVRMGTGTDEDRCKAACLILIREGDTEGDPTGDTEVSDITTCSATPGDADLPIWDPGQLEVAVRCQTQHTRPGFCTGRRPLGHRELATIDCSRGGHSRGAYFAEQAHLERASILAFIELADALARHHAPAELIARCRAAADDEVVHGDLMAELAAREGWDVPVAEAEPARDDLLAVALHNAVEGCVREAFGAVLAAQQARSCPEQLRAIMTRIADDELRHGQLAWDLHIHLLAQLDADARREVEAAQRRALAQLGHEVAHVARRTPAGLGWPTPAQAQQLAANFAALIERQLDQAA